MNNRPNPEDLTIPVGSRVKSTDGNYTGTVTREYIKPPKANPRPDGFYSRPGRRAYVVLISDNPRNCCGGLSISLDACDLVITTKEA